MTIGVYKSAIFGVCQSLSPPPRRLFPEGLRPGRELPEFTLQHRFGLLETAYRSTYVQMGGNLTIPSPPHTH